MPHRLTAIPPAQARLEAIGEAWQLMKPQLLAWMGATLIAVVCGLVIYGVVFVFEFAYAVRSAALHGIGTPPIGLSIALVAVFSVLAAVFGGGLARMAVRQ